MNKTVNINLGGIFFHIDEDAFQKLSRYFDAIKRSLSNSSGQDEIINDIELRVSELLTEKQKSEKHVVGMKDVDEVITVMGQPEDYRIDEDNDAPKASSFASNSGTTRIKKLYRDKDKGEIGGVLAGLGHYFGIERVWLRLAFLILFLTFSVGFWLYIILWIVMPEAITTSEKLEMTGEPVNISNIEKKVREEFDLVSNKIKNADYDKLGNQFKSGAERVGSGFGDFIITMLGIFAKVVGGCLILAGFTVLLFLLIGIFALGTGAFINFPWTNFIESGNYSDYPAWTFGLVMFFAVGIPFFFLTILGFKLLSPAVKSIGRTAIYTLLAIWIIAVALAVSIGIKEAAAFSENGKVVEKQFLNLQPTDTLMIRFVPNEIYSDDLDDNFEFRFIEDSLKNKAIFSTDVSIKFETTNEKQAYIKIEKQAHGKSISEANERAKQIKYHYKVSGNQLVFDNYLITDFKNKFRGQEVEITLYLPKGTIFKCDDSVENYDRSDNDNFNLHFSGNYTYKVDDSKIKCLNCPSNEDEYDDVETEDINETENDSVKTVSVKINGKEVIQTIAGKGHNSLEINKDGVIIKTK
jgi:VCBS repeat-containing protein